MDDPATASAKAIEETAKTTGKALDIVHDTGGYLGRVFGDVPTDLVGVLGGAWLSECHIRIRDRFRRRTEQILRERNVQEFIELSPNLAAALIEGAQEEARDELMELWARLPANAMDPKLNSVRQSFIAAVKAMDPLDAVVLRIVYERACTRVERGGATSERTASTQELAGAIGRRMDEVGVSLTNLERLGLFEMLPEHDRNIWHVNETNREFMRACYPEVERE